MTGSWVRGAFFDAADGTSRLLQEDAVVAAWERPSMVEGFSVGGLAGHVYTALRRVEVALDEPLPEPARQVGVVEFYGVNRIDSPADLGSGLHPLLRGDGERRARQGPLAVQQKFVDLVARLRRRLAVEPSERLVPVVQVSQGVTTLDEYLATRVVELVVHGDDIAASVGVSEPGLPASAMSMAIDTLVELARGRSGDIEVVRAFARSERADGDALRVL